MPADMTAGPGLLDIPEVADVFATLRVLVDPTDDVALLRLLTGPRWNIGAADLAVLTRRAEQIVARGAAATDGKDAADANHSDDAGDAAALAGAVAQIRQEKMDEFRSSGLREELIEQVLEAIPDPTEYTVGLIDALADLTDAEEMGMSAEGTKRLSQLGRELGYLRRHSLGKNLSLIHI